MGPKKARHDLYPLRLKNGAIAVDFCYDWRKSKGSKSFDYQIKSAIEQY
jgi:hypothetical protein